MKRLLYFMYGNFMTLFDRVVVNLKELSPLAQVALALIAVALIFVTIMLLIYIIRISKYRTIKKIENVDVVFFNSVYEFGPYKLAKEGQVLFIILIPFTFVINFVIKAFMFKSFSAINSSDYITRRMLENMQLENMRIKDKNKELLKLIDEAGLNKKPRKPEPRPKRQELPKEEPKKVAPLKEEPKVVEEPKVEEEKEVVAPKATVKKTAAAKKVVEESKVEDEKEVTSSTIVTENDKEPEVILQTRKVEEPVTQEREILEAEVIDPDTDNLDELIGDVATKETRGKA